VDPLNYYEDGKRLFLYGTETGNVLNWPDD